MAVNFNDNSVVIYTPEKWDKYEEGSDGLTGKDFFNLCGGDISLAERVYYMCEWQHPATILAELDMEYDMKSNLYLIRRDETDQWNDDLASEAGAVYGIYLVDLNSVDDQGELFLKFLRNETEKEIIWSNDDSELNFQRENDGDGIFVGLKTIDDFVAKNENVIKMADFKWSSNLDVYEKEFDREFDSIRGNYSDFGIEKMAKEYAKKPGAASSLQDAVSALNKTTIPLLKA